MLTVKQILLLLLIVTIPFVLYAQYKRAYNVTYSGKKYNTTVSSANGVIKCVAPSALLNVKLSDAVIHIYVQNDLKNIPMELFYRSIPIYAKALSSRKPNGEIILFLAHANDIFRPDSANGYSWKWKGRAKCPKSPTDDYNGTQVKKLKCWYVLQAGSKEYRKTYNSDTLTIEVTNANKSL